VSPSGALAGSTNYDAWGTPETAGGLIATTPFGYAGGYTDPDGLIYLLNRYYNPATGQFISVDPAITQTLQPYAYANGNPVSLSDPTGLGWWDYRTYQRTSRISERIYYDYSLQMSDDMVKAAAKNITKVSVYLNVLQNIIQVVTGHASAVVVIGLVSSVLAVIAMNLKKLVALAKKWTTGNGKHAGFYVYTFEDLWGQYYESASARSCLAGTLRCGSPGRTKP
jgi:RHS repeat-associated protein